jgi:4-hydroxythreonine-4-phosphate dehydrogenase
MYHDQGLIPFKLTSGMNGVNFTAGIPIVRTSPDHGVAYDIAGRGMADDTSFKAALYLAIDIYHRRAENQALRKGALSYEKKQVSREEAESTASFGEF